MSKRMHAAKNLSASVGHCDQVTTKGNVEVDARPDGRTLKQGKEGNQ